MKLVEAFAIKKLRQTMELNFAGLLEDEKEDKEEGVALQERYNENPEDESNEPNIEDTNEKFSLLGKNIPKRMSLFRNLSHR